MLDHNNEIFKYHLCDKCYPDSGIPRNDAKPRAKDLFANQVASAMAQS